MTSGCDLSIAPGVHTTGISHRSTGRAAIVIQVVCSWHTFPVRCAAAIASGYRITFAVPVRLSAWLLITRFGLSAGA
jgi:hypothetical protein